MYFYEYDEPKDEYLADGIKIKLIIRKNVFENFVQLSFFIFYYTSYRCDKGKFIIEMQRIGMREQENLWQYSEICQKMN